MFEKNRIDIDLLLTEDLLKSQNYQFEPLSLEILKTASEIRGITLNLGRYYYGFYSSVSRGRREKQD